MERQALALLGHVDDLGGGSMLDGTVEGIEQGWFQGEIADASYRLQRRINSGRSIIVGSNAYLEGNEDDAPVTLYIDDAVEERQLKRLADVKLGRDDDAVRRALARVTADASDPTVNIMPALLGAVSSYATLHEVVAALEVQFGTWTDRGGM
jgi:methylmalonyl-CoA mutase N-terminal domain/subunit